MITEQDVKDLNYGDVVELDHPDFMGNPIIGRVYDDGHGNKVIGSYYLATHGGSNSRPGEHWSRGSVKVIEKAPVPLYVNDSRTVPRLGDVALFDGDVGYYLSSSWYNKTGNFLARKVERGILLVDGETRQAIA